MTSFSQLLVVELPGSAAGGYCGRLFASYGADVVLLDDSTNETSAFYCSAKKRVAGRSNRAELLKRADVVIQSSSQDPIAEPLPPASAQQIVVQISPFAQTGPYAHWRSTDLVDAAIGGHLRLTGDPSREPIQGVPDIIHHAAGVAAFVGAMAALIARIRTGHGQVVATSHQEVVVALHQFSLCRYTHNGAVLNRLGNRYAGAGSPIGAYECADGWVGIALPQEDQMERMLEVTGLINMLELEGVNEVMDLMTNEELLNSQLIPYLKTQSRDDLVELFQLLRLPCAPVSTLEELLADPHLRERDFWRTASDGTTQLPGPPFTLSNHVWTTTPANGDQQGLQSPMPDQPSDLCDGPLTGIKILDMTRVWAGPLATRMLADLGAEVLMTEVPWTRTPQVVADSYVQATHFFPDDETGDRPWNRSAFHNKYAVNKLSTVIELDKPAGRELFAALVPEVDAVVENYSPRVMPGFGFDQDALHQLNPNLVYVTMPGYGRDGPYADWVAYGPTIDGHVGHTWLTGYEGESPWKCGIAWPDPIGGMHGAAACLIGLFDRFAEPTGTGQTVEVAQVEAAINMIGQHVVDAQTTSPKRWGNRRPGRAPQGVYPCAGEDRWIAISITDDPSWQQLCTVAGLDDLSSLSAEQRWEQHDDIDGRLASFTSNRIDVELMSELQAVGVPAGAALDAGQVMADPQLRHLEMFVSLSHADAGTHPWPRFPVRLSSTPATMRRPAALMGEHNAYACALAGYSEQQMSDLLTAGILRIDPPA